MLLTAVALGQAAVPRGTAKKPASSPAAQPVQSGQPAPVPVSEPQPAKPAVPLRPSQMAAVPARVSYANGMLTIVAENSTMADIIAQLRAATGIKIETVGGPSGDRVAARIGPAPVRDVILSLVQGSQYDFIILGVLGQPDAVERVILTPRVAGGNSPAPQPARAARAFNTVYEAPPVETPVDDDNEGFAAPAPQPAQPSPQGVPNPTDPNAPAKTPEQLLEELRRMEEQRNNPQGRPQRPPR